MRRLALIASSLLLCASAGHAGTFTSTIGGSTTVTVVAGTLVSVDNIITFGPTPVGGAGASVELSFDYAGGSVVGGGGATVIPSGWFDLSAGSFSCNDGTGHCEDIIRAGELTGFGASFPSGASFALPSVQIDTTGLAPGVYAISTGLTGPSDAIVNPGAVDLSGEYTTVGAVISIIPEPATAALVALGLVALASARRARL